MALLATIASLHGADGQAGDRVARLRDGVLSRLGIGLGAWQRGLFMTQLKRFRATVALVSSGTLLLASTGMARAQERIWYADGDAVGADFGHSLAATNDFDRDGRPDLLISEPIATCTSIGDGTVGLFSTTGGELSQWCGTNGEALGAAVSIIADVDGDGVQDFVFGASHWDNPNVSDDCGRVLIISSTTGATLLEIDGQEPEALLGAAVAGLPDLDGDGWPEVLVSEIKYSYSAPYQAGRVFIYSSKDASKAMRIHVGEAAGDVFGATVAALGDVDGDGTLDYAIDSPTHGGVTMKGKVYVYSGATGALLWSHASTYNYDEFGTSITDAGDVDGDGYADVLCGGITGPRKVWGHVTAFSGKTGAQIFDLQDATYPGQQFGYSCAMAGDVNHDGFEDFLVGAPNDGHDGTQSGRVDLFSGRTLRALYHFYSHEKGAMFGWRLIGRNDWNQDGIPDFAVTGFYQDKGLGRVSIFAGNDLYLQAEPTNPAPLDTVTIDVRGGEPGTLTLMAIVDVSGTPTFVPILLDAFDANGEASLSADVPSDASGMVYTLIAYALPASGRGPLIDTSYEVVTVQ